MNSTLPLAMELYEYGFNVLAIPANQKAPDGTWKPWITTRQTPADLRSLPWSSTHRVGLVSGIGQLRCVDFDKCPWHVVADFLAILELDSGTYQWVEKSQSGTGFHIWIRCDDDTLPGLIESKGVCQGYPKDGNTDPEKGGYDHLEVRWRGNQTVVAASGDPSLWVNGAPDGPPPLDAGDDVIRAFHVVARSTQSAKPKAADDDGKIGEGGRDHYLTSRAGTMRKDGFSETVIEAALQRENIEKCRPPLPPADVARISHSIGTKPAGTHNQRQPILLLSYDEMMDRPNPEFLIDGIIVKRSLVVLSAPQSHYKSFIALDMACSISLGIDWAGHPTVRGSVLYVCAEGVSGIRKRLQALALAHDGIKPDITTLPMAIMMMVPDVVDELIAAIRESGKDFSVIIIDTLSRTMAGYDENQQKDMSGYVAALERLQRETGATVMVIHHHNRDGKIRGSSVLSGAIDTEMSLKPFSDDVTELYCLKQKDYEYFTSHFFKKVVIDLPDGQTSLVFEPTEPQVSARENRTATNKSETIALAVLDRYPGLQVAKINWLAASGLSKPTFYRAAKGLEAKGLIEEVSEGVYTSLSLSLSLNQSHSPGVSVSPSLTPLEG